MEKDSSEPQKCIDFGDDEDDDWSDYPEDPIEEYRQPAKPDPKPGEILKSCRKRIGKLRARRVNQDEMATLLGVSRRTYIDYEKGTRTVPAQAVQKAMNEANLSSTYELGGRYRAQPVYQLVDDVLDLTEKLIAEFRRSQPDARAEGLPERLSLKEIRLVIQAVLHQRELLRDVSGDAEFQYNDWDIREAVEEYTDYFETPDWCWQFDFDPVTCGGNGFICPVLSIMPKFADIREYRRYLALRDKLLKELPQKEAEIYDWHFKGSWWEHPELRGEEWYLFEEEADE